MARVQPEADGRWHIKIVRNPGAWQEPQPVGNVTTVEQRRFEAYAAALPLWGLGPVTLRVVGVSSSS
jgi:hypothetical protein